MTEGDKASATRVGLLGIPNDDNSSHLRGAAQAPAMIRRAVLSDGGNGWSESGLDLSADGRLVDFGDIVFHTSSDPWALIENRVDETAAAGDPLICLGGDHAITHPVLRSMRRLHGALTIIHIDAHADIYHAFQGNLRSHASPFARIMEENLADRLIQVGLRTINDEHRAQFERFGVEVIDAHRWNSSFTREVDTPVYISLDLDGLDPAFAPGVSHREPGGLTTRQVINMIHTIRTPIIGADIVEYNPRCDIQDMTALVAAKLLREIAGMMIRTDRRTSVARPGAVVAPGTNQ